MQETMSKRYLVEDDKDIAACVSGKFIESLRSAIVTIHHDLILQFDMFNLKLLHLERCKYITANDFFAINFSSMFSVSSASNFYVALC